MPFAWLVCTRWHFGCTVLIAIAGHIAAIYIDIRIPNAITVTQTIMQCDYYVACIVVVAVAETAIMIIGRFVIAVLIGDIVAVPVIAIFIVSHSGINVHRCGARRSQIAHEDG